MSLPLLGNDFLMSPTAGGVISGKTAELLASQGSQMAQQIEMRSQVSEAQMKAPQVTDMYSTAYQKIAQGDFTGFADMQKARSLAIGNPILMKTMDEADQLAGTLAGEYTRKQIAQMQTDKAMELAKFQYDKSMDIEKHRDDRAGEREKERYSHDLETTARATFLQAHSEWNRNNQLAQKQYDEELKLWHKQQAGEDMAAGVLKRPSRQLEPPQKPEPISEPKLEDYLTRSILPSQSVPRQSGPLDQSDLPLPTKDDAPNPYGNMIPSHVPTDSSVLPSQEAPAPESEPPAPSSRRHTTAAPLDDGKTIGEQMDERRVNNDPLQGLVFGYDATKGTALVVNIHEGAGEVKGMKMNSATGGTELDIDPSAGNKKAQEAATALESMGQRENLAKWIALQQRLGHKVEAVPSNPDNSKDKGVIFRTGNNTFSDTTTGPNGEKISKPVVYGEDAKKDWDTITKYSVGPNKIITYDYPPIPDQHKDQMRQAAIEDALKNPGNLDSTNAQLDRLGIDKITPDNIKAKQKEMADAVQGIKTKQFDDRAESDVRATLGLPPKGVTPGKNVDMKEQLLSSMSEIKDLQQEFDNLAKSKPSEDSSGYQKMMDLRKKIIILQDKIKQADYYLGMRGVANSSF